MISKKALTDKNCAQCEAEKNFKKTKKKYKNRNKGLEKVSVGLHYTPLNYKSTQKANFKRSNKKF